MNYASTTLQNQPLLDRPFLVRIGQREISICRDFRRRFYPTNPLIECRAGVNPGHVEVLLMRSWLVVFSKAKH